METARFVFPPSVFPKASVFPITHGPPSFHPPPAEPAGKTQKCVTRAGRQQFKMQLSWGLPATARYPAPRAEAAGKCPRKDTPGLGLRVKLCTKDPRSGCGARGDAAPPARSPAR